MPEPTLTKIDINIPVRPIHATAGQDVVIHGSLTSSHDGSTIDGATTSWPKDAVGGASVDPIGLFDLEAGGLHMTSRDVAKHEVHATVTDKPGEACTAAGVASPCLVVNKQLALKRLLTQQDFNKTMNGTIELEEPPSLAPAIVPPTVVPYLQITFGLFAGALLAFGGWKWKKRKETSPEGRLLALSRTVMTQLERADQVIAAPLKPTVDAAIKAIREKRVDAASKEGQRVAEALRRVNDRLETTAREERAAKEQEAADELLREMESALEAAEEMKRSHS